MPRNISLVLCSLLTGLAVFICVRIEVFNFQVPGQLGRTEPGKWRVPVARGIRMLMLEGFTQKARDEGRLEADGSYRMTSDEQRRYSDPAIDERCEGEAAFRGFVMSWGQLQYIIAPVALAWSFMLAGMKRGVRPPGDLGTGTPARSFLGGQAPAAILAAVALACVGLMFYRDYWGSLGW